MATSWHALPGRGHQGHPPAKITKTLKEGEGLQWSLHQKKSQVTLANLLPSVEEVASDRWDLRLIVNALIATKEADGRSRRQRDEETADLLWTEGVKHQGRVAVNLLWVGGPAGTGTISKVAVGTDERRFHRPLDPGEMGSRGCVGINERQSQQPPDPCDITMLKRVALAGTDERGFHLPPDGLADPCWADGLIEQRVEPWEGTDVISFCIPPDGKLGCV